MGKITVSRALVELKLVTKKIDQKTTNLKIAIGVTSGTPEQTQKEFIEEATKANQKIKDLMTRRVKLKSAIVLSNAKTSLKVGEKTMTVAEAIEQKSSIEIAKRFSTKLRESYYSSVRGVEEHNVKLQEKADKAATDALKADTEGDKGAAYTAVTEAFMNGKNAVLLAPEGIEAEIEKLQEEIDQFEADVDLALNESNTKTEIEV